jgi:TolB-like protein
MCMLPPTAFPSASPRCARGLSRNSASRPSTSADTASRPRCVLTVTRRRSALPRLAIPPFAAGFGIPEHLGPAVAEETIARLSNAQAPAVTVLARDSVFMLASQGLSAQQIGETLKADLVLTGTLRALPSHFRLRAEMIRVEDGAQIWVEDLIVPHSRIAGLESELGDRLAFRLGAELPGNLDFNESAARFRWRRRGPEGFHFVAGVADRRPVHLRLCRARRGAGEHPTPPRGLQASSCAATMSGRRYSAIACRTACNTSSGPPSLIPR